MARYRMKAILPDVTEDDFGELLSKADARRGFWTVYVTTRLSRG